MLTSYIQEDEASDYMNQAEDSTHRREYCLDKLLILTKSLLYFKIVNSVKLCGGKWCFEK